MSGIPGGSAASDDFRRRLEQQVKRTKGQAAAGEGARQVPGAQDAAAPQAQTAQEEEKGPGPVGQGERVIRTGDCLSSIAKETGHFWETIWNDGANSELRETRQDPNVLLRGDRLTVPALREKDVGCVTEKRHRFKRRGEPAKLRLRILEEPDEEETEDEGPKDDTADALDAVAEDPQQQRRPQQDQPRANVPYTLVIDGETFNGQTDADGRIEVNIPGNARRGRLIIEPGTPHEQEIPLRLGATDPLSEISGIKERLENLGFRCGDDSNEKTPELEAALRAFQETYGLEINGKVNEATRTKLRELHGS